MNRTGLAGLTIVVFLLLASAAGAAITSAATVAGPSATIRYVAINGSDAGSECSVATAPCRTVQYAIDQALAGDEIRIAAGLYTGVSSREGVTQTVYLSKTLTLTGGFTTANWTTPDAEAHPTVLNAQGGGRVLYIAGNDSIVQGLRITGGDATGLHSVPTAHVGGGIYVDGGAPTIRNCGIFTNTASASPTSGQGGGVFLNESNAILANNLIQSNTAASHSTGYGGGVYAKGAAPSLSHNRIQNNIASETSIGFGGGVYLYVTNAVLAGNAILNNTADTPGLGSGGGVYNHISASDLTEGMVHGNSAKAGGGLYFYGSDHNIPITLVNTVIAGNQASSIGSGLYAEGVELQLLHATISGNTGGDGSGVHVATHVWGQKRIPSTARLINTIVVNQTQGITVTAGSTVTVDSVLWHGNTADWAGQGSVSHTRDHTGDPLFADDGYHILGESPARDAGQDVGIRVDIDGQRRPMHRAVDIGADEFPARTLFLPFLSRTAS